MFVAPYKSSIFFFFQAEDGIRDYKVTGVQTCGLPICFGRGNCERARLNRRRHEGGLRTTPSAEVNPRKRGRRQERGASGQRQRRDPNARRSHNLCYINDLRVLRQKLASVVRQKFLNTLLLTAWQRLYQPRSGAPADRCLRREASLLSRDRKSTRLNSS